MDRTTIHRSKMFHVILKNLQFKAINFMTDSVVNIAIKMLLIIFKIESVLSDCP